MYTVTSFLLKSSSSCKNDLYSLSATIYSKAIGNCDVKSFSPCRILGFRDDVFVYAFLGAFGSLIENHNASENGVEL